jgi:site-specific DNA recombinase
MQNPRSPDQQRDQIERAMAGRPWTIVKVYRDDGISGRLIKGRPGFQEMLDDITLGRIQADLILVDTFERFGRAEECLTIRQTLATKYGVLVLTADTQFSDPTTSMGLLLSAIEVTRAKSSNETKAHDVLRGKIDTVHQKHWPGGKPPLGYQLESVMKVAFGRQELDYCLLVPNPQTRHVIQLLFDQAEATAWGTPKLAKWLNEHPDVPAELKPIGDSGVAHLLDNPIYYGELKWNSCCTDVIDDRRVRRSNLEHEIVRVPEFCEPLVTRDQWETVQAFRQARRERHPGRKKCGKINHDKKLIKPSIQGLALTFPLSGLVICGSCGRRMVARSCPPFIAQSGEERRYVRYECPANRTGGCSNSTRVHEAWLREQVISSIRDLLLKGDFPN